MALIEELPNAYWVIEERFLAGGIPLHADGAEARHRLRQLLLRGIDAFLDLTEPGEYGAVPYEPLLRAEAALLHGDGGARVDYTRLAISDRGLPSPELARRGLALINEHLAAGRNLYLHCFGGIGRTGTLVGCYLAEHGFPGEAALRELRRLRGPRLSLVASPETPAQCAFVRTWGASR